MVLRLPLLHTAIRIESAPGGWGGADGMREAAVRKAGIQQEHAVAAACATYAEKVWRGIHAGFLGQDARA